MNLEIPQYFWEKININITCPPVEKGLPQEAWIPSGPARGKYADDQWMTRVHGKFYLHMLCYFQFDKRVEYKLQGEYNEVADGNQ